MRPTSLDHLLAATLVLAFPVYAAWSQRKLVRALSAGQVTARMRDYHLTMGLLWSLVALTQLRWWQAGRPWTALGLTLSEGTRVLQGAGASALALLVLAVQWSAIRRLDAASREQLASQLGAVSEFLPASAREYRTFQAVAVTAGICEEVLYRAFLLWYGAAFVGVWPAVLLTGAVFGLVHFYQGAAGVLKTGLAGLFFGALYALTDSLLWPILVHIAVDLQGGAIGWALRGTRALPRVG